MRIEILRNLRQLSIGVALVLGILISCTEEEVTSRTYPRVTTLSVSHGSNTMTLAGEVVYAPVEMTDHGFIYTTVGFPVISNSFATVVSMGTKTGTGKFVKSISSLEPGKRYSVRAFARSTSNLVYGETKEFENK